MPLHVKLFATLRRFVPGYDPYQGLALDMSPGTSPAQIIRQLGLPPEDVTQILVDGCSSRRNTSSRAMSASPFFPPLALANRSQKSPPPSLFLYVIVDRSDNKKGWSLTTPGCCQLSMARENTAAVPSQKNLYLPIKPKPPRPAASTRRWPGPGGRPSRPGNSLSRVNCCRTAGGSPAKVSRAISGSPYSR